MDNVCRQLGERDGGTGFQPKAATVKDVSDNSGVGMALSPICMVELGSPEGGVGAPVVDQVE